MPAPLARETSAPPPIDAGASPHAGGPVEVFDENGHLAGQDVELQRPACDADGRTPPGAVSLRVMGFARVSLNTGTWEVESFRSTPAKLEVSAVQLAFVLRKFEPVPGIVEGVVVDDQSQPVARAAVTVGDERKRARRRHLLSSAHQVPEGDHVSYTNARGEFALKTYEASESLVASKDGRTSAPMIATAGGRPTRLRLFTPAWARFSSSCLELFIQYDYQGDTIELAVIAGTEVMVASGARKFRARCFTRGTVMSASTEAQPVAGGWLSSCGRWTALGPGSSTCTARL